MAEEKPLIHIDTDWKRQAQEEKKRLIEQEAKKAAAAPAAPSIATPAGAPTGATSGAPAGAPAAQSPSGAGPRSRGEVPQASFASLVQSVFTQTLYYLGELASRGGEGAINLDMARVQIDTLGVLEEKTKGNLTADEQRILDTLLYETRMRFVSVAAQYIV